MHRWRGWLSQALSKATLFVTLMALLAAMGLGRQARAQVCSPPPASADRPPVGLWAACAERSPEATKDQPVWPAAASKAPEFLGTGTAFAKNIFLGQGELVSHDVTSLASPVLLGLNFSFLSTFEFSRDLSTLYAIEDATELLGTVSTVDGSFTEIGHLIPPPEHRWTSLVVDPRHGTLYGIAALEKGFSSSQMLIIDPATVATTPVATIAVGLIGASMNCQGEMYGIAPRDDSLYAIDPKTGAETRLGSLGFDISFSQDIDFDNATGVLYQWMFEVDNLLGRYGSLDLTTGAFHSIDLLPMDTSYVGATATRCGPEIFSDGFESGDIDAW